MVQTLIRWAKELKSQLLVLYFSCQDKRSPWYAKWAAILVVGYAFSPIDLIPDFIPILGFLDDVVLLPIGISIAIKLMPDQVLNEHRIKVRQMEKQERPKNWIVGSLIICFWLAVIAGGLFYLTR